MIDIPDWLSCANCHHRRYLEDDPEVELCTSLITEIPAGEDFAPECHAFSFRAESTQSHRAQRFWEVFRNPYRTWPKSLIFLWWERILHKKPSPRNQRLA